MTDYRLSDTPPTLEELQRNPLFASQSKGFRDKVEYHLHFRENLKGVPDHAALVLAELGIIDADAIPEAVSEPVRPESQPVQSVSPAPAKPRQKPIQSPSQVPATGVETRPPVDQNDHTLAMVNSHLLVKTPLAVAMVASVELAIEGSKRGRPFHRAEREMTPEYLSGKTGFSKNACRDAMADAVRLGFFERTDTGKGGQHGRGKATYRPTLPAYMELPQRAAS